MEKLPNDYIHIVHFFPFLDILRSQNPKSPKHPITTNPITRMFDITEMFVVSCLIVNDGCKG